MTEVRDESPAMEPDLTRLVFVSYIERARRRALAAGRTPHRWPHFADAPFTLLPRPLREARIGLVTTASLLNPDGAPPPEGRPPMRYAASTDPAPARLHTAHLGWDRDATHMDDLDSYFPIHCLAEFHAEGRIGALSPRYYGAHVEDDGPRLLEWCREDGVDAVVLVPI